MLAAVAALAAGGLARGTATPALAGTDGDMVLGAVNAAGTTTTLNATGGGANGAFRVTNTAGRGIVVDADQNFNGLVVDGEFSAIVATNAAHNSGVPAISATADDGMGVQAVSTANTGVRGQTTSGIGVHGSSNSSIGIYGNSNTGVGARGDSGASFGVVGTSTASHGVFGDANTGSGAFGRSVSGSGVSGQATGTGNGVTGTATSGTGVYGTAGSGVGVFGTSASSAGVAGTTTNNHGVFGDATAGGNGLFGRTVNGNGLVAQATGAGNAATFFGSVVVNGSFTVAPGFAKSGSVLFPDGTVRRLYATEAPESWFEDYGEARLVNGRASVALDREFLLAVNTAAAYHVFLTPHTAEIEALAVTVRAPDHFEVQANGKGEVAGTFSYRVVAKRKDIAGPRFERVTLQAAPTAPAADALARPAEPPKLPAMPELTPEQRAVPTAPPPPPTGEGTPRRR
jgi:hypothetical protein